MVDKIWLSQYPENTPAEIDTSEFASLKELVERLSEIPRPARVYQHGAFHKLR